MRTSRSGEKELRLKDACFKFEPDKTTLKSAEEEAAGRPAKREPGSSTVSLLVGETHETDETSKDSHQSDLVKEARRHTGPSVSAFFRWLTTRLRKISVPLLILILAGLLVMVKLAAQPEITPCGAISNQFVSSMSPLIVQPRPVFPLPRPAFFPINYPGIFPIGRAKLEETVTDSSLWIDFLRQKGKVEEARLLEKDVNLYRTQALKWQSGIPAVNTPELHVIDVWMGRKPHKFSHNGVVDIHVGGLQAPLVLAIRTGNEYDLTCNFQIDTGVQIQRVIISQPKGPTCREGVSSELHLNGLPPGAPITVTHSLYPDYCLVVPELETIFEGEIESLARCPLASYIHRNEHGSYVQRDDSGKYNIGPKNDDWRFQYVAYRINELCSQSIRKNDGSKNMR